MVTVTLLLMTKLLLLLLLLCSTVSAAPTPVNVGVILDLDSAVGKISKVSLTIALSDYISAHPNSSTSLNLIFRDSRRDPISAASAAIDLISNHNVVAILGPQTSSAASFVIYIAAKCHVPVISFSATSTSVSPSQSKYFVRAAVADPAAAAPISALVSYFSWRRVVPIYEDSVFGASFVPSLLDSLDAVGSQIPYRLALPVSASDSDIEAYLYRLKTLQTRVFVVHVTSILTARVFDIANKAGLMDEGFVWIATDAVIGNIVSLDQTVVADSMQGVLGVKPYMPKSDRLRNFRSRWRTEFLIENKNSEITDVGMYGVWAYDALFALAMAIEAARPTTSSSSPITPPSASSPATDLSRLPVLATGEKLLAAILATEFDGLAGRFRLDRGELNVSAFQVVNMVGEKGHGVGFWTASNGLSRRLSVNGSTRSGEGIGTVIWPGDSREVPKGFVQPSGGKKMRIAVPGPVEQGFQAFLKVTRDPETNRTTASGFVIDVFEAAVSRLPYALVYEYVANMDKDGKSLGNYNWLVQQVPEVSTPAIFPIHRITQILLLNFMCNMIPKF